MNGKYPSILFHFTRQQSSLQGILQETFKPSMARERIETDIEVKEFAVPMISFCDLRLSELRHHMDKYGHFGIGMSKEWAMREGLNPVSYVNPKSEFTNHLIDGIKELFDILDKANWPNDLSMLDTTYMKIFNVQRYIKNYKGNLIRGGQDRGIYTFADEREWRYVLPLFTKLLFPVVPISMIDTPEKKAAWNEQISSHKLGFKAADIKYLIVKKESNAARLREYIHKLKNYETGEKDHMLARIVTADQIFSDM
ncbi:hypothetical protein UNDKW_3739 [Undibacterium sp. KW1]|uniref:abortive infection system antitoxin AbiGi family protein n=1 Tax=Undibacterium sp. KW1 TaxID=2058624 RepID=UPI001331F0AA|nr:abortive infection system antitoxin AbiGi family protein [Undibacterium sp. KW1]BBB62012.1 hypothetical protein UNDKW_3739 [Undibacterium sp. KW1]